MTRFADSRLRADVFPARVVFHRSGSEPEVYEKVRVVVTVDALFVFKDSAQGPTLSFFERLAKYDPGVPTHRRTRARPARPALATTNSGIEVTFSRLGSCGCGSRLRSFDPFSQIPMAASTKDL